MKIALSVTGNNLDAMVDSRFGRCPYFVVVDVDTLEFEAVPNVSQSMGHGAGVQAAQTITSRGIRAVLTGNMGPNAYQAFSVSGVRVITGVSGTVRQAVMKYKNGEFKEAGFPTVRGHFGAGRGQRTDHWGGRV